MTIRILNAEIEGALHDVVLEPTGVALLDGERVDGDVAVDAAGGALIPGLHDHHLHLLAMAAPSVNCAAATDLETLGALLRKAYDNWVRARGYHESIAGELDRYALDRLVPDRPARVQHRSGALWILNSRALDAVAHVLDDTADVERDERGEPTGRLWRYDARLRPALPRTETDLAAVGDELLRYGITSVTDATPDLEPEAIEIIASAQARGALPQQVTLLGAPDSWEPRPGLTTGPAKLLLRDHDLPDVSEIAAWIAARREHGRAVAVHCVTSDSLALVIAALDEVGACDGDRIEHASVVPSGLVPDLARLGIRVVTQPDFVRTRGDDYLRDIPASEVPFLYPYCSLVDAGIPTAPSSDAPYGSADPWQVIASATRRTTLTGATVNPSEAVAASRAFTGYLSDPTDPGGTARTIRAGEPASVVLLNTALPAALESPEAGVVRMAAVSARITEIH